MIVDNGEPDREATAAMLHSLGYRVDTEANGPRALRLFSEAPNDYDLAIIEPLLPDLGGLSLGLRFRDIRPGFPVLFYAGYVDMSLSRRIEAAGFERVAFKPSMLGELAAAVKDLKVYGPLPIAFAQ